MIDDPPRYLKIIPNIGWDDGVNVSIVDPHVTIEDLDDEKKVLAMDCLLVAHDTLIVKIKRISNSKSYYLGFLPLKGIFVVAPTWIFSEATTL